MIGFITGFLSLLAFVSLPSLTRAADPYGPLSVLRIEKKPAPDFSLPAVGGKTVRLSGYKGKAVLLGFFQTF
jgi:hypothetical protein